MKIKDLMIRARRFLGFVLTWRRVGFGAAVLATLVAGFYIVENWRGERAWAAARDRLQAAGEPLNLEDFRPTPPPDDENFMMAPVFVRRFGIGEGPPSLREPWEWEPGKPVRPPVGGATPAAATKDGQEEDGLVLVRARESTFAYEALGGLDGVFAVDMALLAACLPAPFTRATSATEASAAQAILDWSRQWESDFLAMAEAARTRPKSHLAISLSENHRIQQWNVMDGWLDGARVLHLRALAQVVAQDRAGARDSILILVRMAEAPTMEPTFLLGTVLAAAIQLFPLQVIHEGLRRHLWSVEDLKELDQWLARLDLRAAFSRSWRGDRLYFQHLLDVGATKDPRFWAREARSWLLFSALAPRGWLRQNQAMAADWQSLHQSRLRHPAFDRPAPPAYPERKSWTAPYSSWFSIMTHGVHGVESTLDVYDANTTLARIALAVEAHRQQTQVIPRTLANLTTLDGRNPLLDPYTGKPFGIAEANGHPRLWSAGPDGIDGGGDTQSDDIVWAYGPL